jgi:hypothetical protein
MKENVSICNYVYVTMSLKHVFINREHYILSQRNAYLIKYINETETEKEKC